MYEWLELVAMRFYLLEPLSRKRCQFADDSAAASARATLPKRPNFVIEFQVSVLDSHRLLGARE